ncbi:hypothetical protein [Anaerovibrio sp.]
MFIDKPGYYYRRDNPESSVRSDKLFAINEEYGFICSFCCQTAGPICRR